jgi:hypothetical protein
MRYSTRGAGNGKDVPYDVVTRHYFEFPTKFSEDLFRPVERPGEPIQ